MKRLSILLLISLMVSVYVYAEEPEADTDKGVWKTKGNFAINASQTSFTNWAAGGDNSITGNSFFNYSANYKKNQMTWDNTIDLGIGYMKQGESSFFKNDDRIALSSKYGRYAFEHWYYSGLVSFRSQFAEGLKSIADDTRVSNFMAPAYITISIGMDFKPNDNLTVLMSPLAGRTTFVLDTLLSNQGAYGVTAGENIRNEFGGFIKVEYSVDLMENVGYKTNLELFSNYLDKPQNIDVNWDNSINLKINAFLSANIRLTMIYDDDIHISYDSNDDGILDRKGPKLQLRNIFGVGLTYKF
jgi:hypothetical protein